MKYHSVATAQRRTARRENRRHARTMNTLLPRTDVRRQAIRNAFRTPFNDALIAGMLILALQNLTQQGQALAQTVRQTSKFVIARLKYGGGGDWYNDPSSEINMLKFLRDNTNIDVEIKTEEFVEIGSEKLFSYPFIFMTGHGNVSFTEVEAKNLRNSLYLGNERSEMRPFTSAMAAPRRFRL